MGIAAGVAFASHPAVAQSPSARPLHAFEAEALPFGQQELALGMTFRGGVAPVPLLDPNDRGDLWQAPMLHYRLGLGRAEFAVGGPVRQYFQRDVEPSRPGPRTSADYGDFDLSFKVEARRGAPGHTSLGFVVDVKLPNAEDLRRLGTNQTDVLGDVIISHPAGVKGVVTANLGLAILDDPQNARKQLDLLAYAVGGHHGSGNQVLWEVWGQALGKAERHVTESTARLGWRHVSGRVATDVSLLHGLVAASGGFGAEAGCTFAFGRPR